MPTPRSASFTAAQICSASSKNQLADSIPLLWNLREGCSKLFAQGSVTNMRNGDRSRSHRTVARLVFRQVASVAWVHLPLHCFSSRSFSRFPDPPLYNSVASIIDRGCRQQDARTIFVGPAAPQALKDAMITQTWAKTSFDVRALIGKTQVVWVYDATCRHSNIQCALKCYRKESQSQINYQYVTKPMSENLTAQLKVPPG